LEACSLARDGLKIKESDQGRSTHEQNSKEKSVKVVDDFYQLMFVLGWGVLLLDPSYIYAKDG